MKKFFIVLVLLPFSLLTSCGEKTDVVESGTYQGTVDEIEEDKTEIYVKTADGKLLELYFSDSTSLTKAGQPVLFNQIGEGDKVEVEVVKNGKSLNPISVKILE